MTIDEAARQLSTPAERILTCRKAIFALEKTIRCAAPESMPTLRHEWETWQGRLKQALAFGAESK